MNGSELAKILAEPPYANAQVLTKVGAEWCETFGVAATGEHRNGVALVASNPHLNGGVIVVESDE